MRTHVRKEEEYFYFSFIVFFNKGGLGGNLFFIFSFSFFLARQCEHNGYFATLYIIYV